MKSTYAVALLAALGASAAAAELPVYDLRTHCDATAGIVADAQVKKFMIDACLQTEQESRTKIRDKLGFFDDQTIKQCDALARATAGGSYQALAGCLALDISSRFLDGKIDIVPRKSQAR